jgi:hypothetical protein
MPIFASPGMEKLLFETSMTYKDVIIAISDKWSGNTKRYPGPIFASILYYKKSRRRPRDLSS